MDPLDCRAEIRQPRGMFSARYAAPVARSTLLEVLQLGWIFDLSVDTPGQRLRSVAVKVI